MACCTLLSSIVFSPTLFAAETLTHTDHDGMYGAHLLNRSEIKQNDDGSFDVTVDMYTYYSMLKENRTVSGSTDDFYVVDRDGYYFVELWGGDGASLGSAKGGLGGYVNGIIALEVGDVIFYTLGGAGTASSTTGAGGGANGGGNAGPSGNTIVGGGGGYSAAFLYKNGTEAEHFYTTYTVDGDHELTRAVTEADRTSKYIMIAGGGGGAGAGGNDKRAFADGGAGGYAETASGTLSAENGYTVPGTFYAGVSGNSTDGSGNYAGKGGTDLPGKVVSTVWGAGKGSQPNDWVGAQNKNLDGGAGGDGDYQGGGGGAGFAGGSGGVMQNTVYALGVGGGGGGSSFVSELFSHDVSNVAEGYKLGRERADKRAQDPDGTLGGYFHITFLDEENVDYLKNLNVEFARTPFFTLTNLTVTNTVGGITYTNDPKLLAQSAGDPNVIESFPFTSDAVDPTPTEIVRMVYIENTPYDLATNKCGETLESELETLKLSILGVSLMPNTKTGVDRDHLEVALTFTPKSQFAGGNNIPLFANSKISCTPMDQPTNSHHVTGVIPMDCYCGYVNVPLKLDPDPIHHTSQGLDPANLKYKVSSLFRDNYKDVRENLEEHWQYYFLESIDTHKVFDENGTEIPVYESDGVTEATISPDETKRFKIELTATPKLPTGKSHARVGDPVSEKTFTAFSVITVSGSGIEPLGKNLLIYNKTLTFDEQTGLYALSLELSSDSSGSIQDETKLPKFEGVVSGETDENGNAISPADPYTVTASGTYTITLKGGKGGQGGQASISLIGTRYGGAGGDGAHLSASYQLEIGTKLYFSAGASARNTEQLRQGGVGGSYSYVAVLKEDDTIDYYLMIAAGGPGGGGASLLLYSGEDGQQPTAITQSADKLSGGTDLSSYNGKNGEAGPTGRRGAAGTPGPSYVYTGSSEGVSYVEDSADNVNTPAGTPIGGTGDMQLSALAQSTGGSAAELGNYTLTAAISKYFTVEDVTVSDVKAGTNPTVLTNTPKTQKYAAGAIPLSDSDEDFAYQTVTANISVGAVPLNADGTIKHVEFTANILLRPRDKFLGGNDVKIIEPERATTGMLTGMTLALSSDSSQVINIDESRTADYANVALDPSLQMDEDDLITQNQTYVLGDTLYKKDLVESVTFPSLESYTWEDDYVSPIDPTTDETLLAPSHTTEYPITAGMGPSLPAQSGSPTPAAEPLTVTKPATVYTDFTVTYDLTHIDRWDNTLNQIIPETTDYILFSYDEALGGYFAEEAYVFYLKVAEESGDHEHHLPKSITVTVDGKVLTDGYTYDRGYDTGSHNQNLSRAAIVTIDREKINGNVTVSAAACEEHHTLYYSYQLSPESDETVTVTVENKHYSEHVDPYTDLAAPPTDTETHKFEWDYGDLSLDPEGHPIMPKGDAWVTGRYLPKEFEVTVNYVDEDGNEISAPVTGTYAYGTEYNIPSPTVSGYAPDRAAVVGTVDQARLEDGRITETVVYTEAEGPLTIFYLYADGSQAAAPVQELLKEGDVFAHASPEIEGYTASEAAISGVMTAGGLSYTVVYTANRYTLTFKVDGEILETRTVEYGNIYAYDADSGSYTPFPIPVKLGYTFEGWVRGSTEVLASDSVTAENITLTPRFRAMSFAILLHYVTDHGTEAFASRQESVTVGETYSYESPVKAGYTFDIPLLTGKMPAQNLSFTVTYTRNTYTVTVHYDLPSGAPTVPDHVERVLHGNSYEIVTPVAPEYPELAAYRPNMAAVSGTVNAADVTVTVSYYSTAIQVDVAWGDMTFSYDLGTWHPDTQTYSGGSFAPVGDNSVSVTNNTVDKNIAVGFEFVVASEYPALMGYYTDSKGARIEEEAVLGTKQTDKSTTVYFMPEDPTNSLGSIALPDTFIAGTCTITIRESN